MGRNFGGKLIKKVNTLKSSLSARIISYALGVCCCLLLSVAIITLIVLPDVVGWNQMS
jgi:hypothetical protein